MLLDIVAMQPLENWCLALRFENGVEGVIDVAECVPFDGVFAPLRDPVRFREVYVDPELGTVVWPCGADLAPDVLYSMITRQQPAGARELV